MKVKNFELIYSILLLILNLLGPNIRIKEFFIIFFYIDFLGFHQGLLFFFKIYLINFNY